MGLSKTKWGVSSSGNHLEVGVDSDAGGIGLEAVITAATGREVVIPLDDFDVLVDEYTDARDGDGHIDEDGEDEDGEDEDGEEE